MRRAALITHHDSQTRCAYCEKKTFNVAYTVSFALSLRRASACNRQDIARRAR